jgi:hypothetical protein
MSPIRQQLLDTIEQAPEAELTEILHLLQSRHIIPKPTIDSSTQTVKRNPYSYVESQPVRSQRRGFPVDAAKLEQGMADFVSVVGRVLR